MYGKFLIVSFNDNEDMVFQHIVELLSKELSCVPIALTEQSHDFTIDPFTRTFTNSTGQEIYLTAKEFDLLHFLMLHKGQVFTKEQLYDNVWGYDYVSDAKNLTGFIRKLRMKIEPDPQSPKYILTVWGVGYKFNQEKP